MFGKLFLPGAAVALAASQAIAADVVEQPLAFDWSGPYVGINAGYAWADLNGSVDTPNRNALHEPISDFLKDALEGTNAEGFTGGMTLGFNRQWDNFVVGIEGDANFADIDDSSETTEDIDLGDGTTTVRARDALNADFLATLRLRAGLALDQTLIYVTGGGAYTDAEAKSTIDWDADFGCPDAGELQRCHSGDANFDFGWTIGAGIEHAFSQVWSIKAEYLYVDFGKNDFKTTNPTNSDQTIEHKFDLNMQIVRIGLNWHF